MKRTSKRKERTQRRRKTKNTGQEKSMLALIKASRKAVRENPHLSPVQRRHLKRLGNCSSCREAHKVIQRGGILPFLPLLAAAGPLIGKALLGIGAAAAGTAVSSAVKKAINK